jgi:hypothetical protein
MWGKTPVESVFDRVEAVNALICLYQGVLLRRCRLSQI